MPKPKYEKILMCDKTILKVESAILSFLPNLDKLSYFGSGKPSNYLCLAKQRSQKDLFV